MIPFMISCEEASLLISQQLDQPLRFGDKLHLGAHLLMCKSCPTLKHKFELIRNAGKQLAEINQEFESENLRLSPEAKKRIATMLGRK